MKRTSIFAIAGIAAASLIAAVSSAQEFSKPVIVGGDQSNATPVEKQASDAISLQFFSHPKTQAAVNFMDDTGKIQFPGMQDVYVGDIVGTPGFVFNGDVLTIQANSEMLDHPDARIQPTVSPLNGLGPDDLRLNFPGLNLTIGLDLQVGSDDQRSHRIVIGDVRDETQTPDETMALFGLQDALEAGLIGDADEVLPYEAPLYPASIIYEPVKKPFKWCIVPNFKLPWAGYGDACKTLPNYPSGALSNNEYGEVFLYDMADVGNGFVAPSYDPLLVNTNSALYMKAILPGPIPIEAGHPYTHDLKYAYYSPLAMFRKVNDAGSARYRFSGYTSWDMPFYNGTAVILNPKEWFLPKWNLWSFIFTNWILPTATNPVAVEAVDMRGASSWQECANPQQCLDQMLAEGHPDTDVAVAYQTTFFDLDKMVSDIFGRPAVFGDGAYHPLNDLLVTGCDGGQGTACPNEAKLDATVFPDRILSLMLMWKQENQWQQGGPTGPYTNMNPSHVFEPSNDFAALIGPGVYDTAVLTDNAKDAAKRKERVLVPSEFGGAADQALIYDVNMDNPQVWFKAMYADFTGGVGATGGEVKCDQVTEYKKTPFHRPDLVRIDRPQGQGNSVFVPYQIRSGDLDGNACEDFIVTWRGKNVIDQNTLIKFDDGAGNMFSNRVTIVLRSDQGGKCALTPAANYPAGIPQYIEIPVTAGMTQAPQVASAAIGDFDGDLKNDIVAGNQISENFNGENTAVAYVFKQGKSFSTIACGTSMNDDCERIRVGAKTGAGLPGVAMITADRTKGIGLDAIAQINGLPLMLPKIGCPNKDPTAVGSIFETYVSLFTNFMAQWAYNNPKLQDVFEHKLPFVDDPNAASPLPLPERCVQQEYCGEQTSKFTSSPSTSYIPLLKNDPCCDCNAYNNGPVDWQTHCGDYLQAYGKKFSCQLYNYAMTNHCAQVAQKEIPFIDRQNRDLAQAGEGADAASNWKADMVVSDDRHAIANAAKLEQVDLMVQAPKMYQESNESMMLALDLPLSQLLGDWIESTFTAAPGEAKQIADAIRSDQGMKDTDRVLNSMISKAGIVGPPLSAEELFLKPVAGAFRASTDMQPQQQLAAGCSLIASVNLPGGTKFVAGGNCGNGQSDQGEQCGEPTLSCWPGLQCVDCKCVVPPPIMNYKVKLPKGIAPQPREMTTVVRKVPPMCNGDRIKNDPAPADCDTGVPWMQPQLTPQELTDLLKTQCTDATQGAPIACEMATCKCVYEQTACAAKKGQPGVQCTQSNDCQQGQICDVNCQCQTTGQGPGPGPLPGPLPSAANPCTVHCLKYSSDDIKAMYEKINAEARQWINEVLPAGQTYDGDLFCEPEMPFVGMVGVAAGSAPNVAASDLSLSLSYAGETVNAQNQLPYSWIQQSGSVPDKIGQYMEFTTVTKDDAFRLAPLPSTQPNAQIVKAQIMKALVVPDISAGVRDLSNADVSYQTDGTQDTNGMYKLRTYSALPGQTVTIQGPNGPSAQTVEPMTELPAGTALTIHELTYTLSPLCGPYTAVEGFRPDICKNIEDQQRDPAALKAAIQENIKAGKGICDGALVGLPFEANARYEMRLDQNIFVPKGQEAKTVTMYLTNNAGGPSQWGMGSGGCKCNLSSGASALQSALPAILVVIVPLFGIAIRRKKK